MTLSDLASIGSFISGLAVVVTLIFMTLQLRQNRIQMAMAELNAGQTRFSAFRLALANDRDVAKMFIIGQNDGVLDEVDELRFYNLLNEQCWNIAHIWDRGRRGAHTGDIPSPIPYMASFFTSQRGRAAWRKMQSSFDPRFVHAMEEAITSARAGMRKDNS